MRRISLSLLACLALFMGACGTEATPDAAPDVSADDAAPSTDGPGPTGAKGGDKKATAPENAAPQNPAPDFEVTTFAGDRFALAEQRGTPVVLNFWESW